MQNYVLGFMFSSNKESVLLIKKNHPAWQAGKLNGVGGKVKDNESPMMAMRREFEEETGYKRRITGWNPLVSFVISTKQGLARVFCFYAFGLLNLCKTMTDEELIIVSVDRLREYPVIDNLHWLINFALDPDLDDYEELVFANMSLFYKQMINNK